MTTGNSLSVTLPAEDQILITRQFAAPRHLVYRAWTEPELIKRWWAGDRGQVTSVQVDLRIGGTWRFVMSASSGFEAAFHGEYLELVPNGRIVSTEVFEAVPDATAVKPSHSPSSTAAPPWTSSCSTPARQPAICT